MPNPASEAAKNPFRAGVAQLKFRPSIDGNLESIHGVLREAARQRVSVVLFPECAVTGYRFPFETLTAEALRGALEQIGRWAASYRLEILVGSPVFRKDGKLSNALLAYDARGRIVHCYAKIQLTAHDRHYFVPGNHLALFKVSGLPATSIICHERRYPELVRIAAMGGARVLFHPNAGLDSLRVSRTKRGGRDGIAVRAFENSIYYLFANSVGSQGEGRWSAGDSKIVAPDGRVLALADHLEEGLFTATIDPTLATGHYARESLGHPRFLAPFWKRIIAETSRRARSSLAEFDLPRG